MSDIQAHGFKSMLAAMLPNEVGAMTALIPNVDLPVEHGDTVLLTVSSPTGHEVIRAKRHGDYLIAEERGLSGTTAMAHPKGACVEWAGHDFDGCALVFQICESDEARENLRKCLGIVKLESDVTSLTEALSNVADSVMALSQTVADLKGQMEVQFQNVTVDITQTKEAIAVAQTAAEAAQNCCDQNTESMQGLQSNFSSTQDQLNVLTNQYNVVTQWLNTFDINDFVDNIDCNKLLTTCPNLATKDDIENGGGGGGDSDPEPDHAPDGTVVRTEGIGCRCPSGTDLQGVIIRTIGISLVSNGDGIYQIVRTSGNQNDTLAWAGTAMHPANTGHPAVTNNPTDPMDSQADALAYFNDVINASACEFNDPTGEACMGK